MSCLINRYNGLCTTVTFNSGMLVQVAWTIYKYLVSTPPGVSKDVQDRTPTAQTSVKAIVTFGNIFIILYNIVHTR